MSLVLVTKRDGSVEEFQVEKVKKCIEWACEDLEVNPLALESKFNEYMSENISSKSIQNNLVMSAKMLSCKEETDWTVVSGRLWNMQLWKERKGYGISLSQYLEEMIDSKEYYGGLVESLLDNYTSSDIIEFGNCIDYTRDLSHSYGSVLTATEKYLTPNECIQQMHIVNAMVIGMFHNKDERKKFVIDLYNALSKRKLSLATPWLGNLRTGGNISSCFIIEPEDSIESIFDNVKNAALISKMGGGLGISLARIRAQGSSVSGRENASKGIFGWTKIYNDVALFVDQGGKRAGAFTIACPVWHRDFEEFLHIQSETGESRNKSFDIFPQIQMHDLFMKLDQEDGNNLWYTFCPYEVKTKTGLELYSVYGEDFEKTYNQAIEAYKEGVLKNVAVYKVRDLIKSIMKAQFDSGLPYVNYVDTINADNPNNHVGTIPCGNLCQESFSVVVPDVYAHTCNLASIVVGRCDDLEEVIEISKLATRVLEYGIEITNDPIKISESHNSHFRTIGVGIQGLHDWFAKENKSYRNYEEASELMEAIQLGCVSESIEMSKEFGKYHHFEGSKWDTGEQFDKYLENPLSVFKEEWKALKSDCKKYGIRNSQLTSPAPNTSTSVFMDAGAGVMPAYGSYYQKDNGNGLFPFASMYVKENPLAYAKNAARHDHKELVDCVSAIQKFVDAGISTEYFLDHNKEGFTVKELYDLLHYTWQKKTKAVYYIRHIKKGKSFNDVVGAVTEGCDGCSG